MSRSAGMRFRQAGQGKRQGELETDMTTVRDMKAFFAAARDRRAALSSLDLLLLIRP